MHTHKIHQMTKDLVCMLPRQETGRFRGLILSGRSGSGKTSVAMNLLPGAALVRLTMTTRSYENFGTYPCPVKGQMETPTGPQETVEIKNLVIERELLALSDEQIGEGFATLLLDDVTCADERLQNAILELVQFGRIGDVQLGRNVLIVITGNGIEDGCFATSWSKALLGRCNLVNYEPDFKQWLELECNRTLAPEVVAFLSDHPELFAPAARDPKACDKNGKTPCPRDWTALGCNITEWGGYAAFRPNVLYRAAGDFCKASIGYTVGEAFDCYTRLFALYPTSKEILNDPSVWSQVPIANRRLLSGALGVAFGLRSNVIRDLNDLKQKGETKQLKEARKTLLQKLYAAVRAIAQDHREVVAFVYHHLLQWACNHDIYVGGQIAETLASEAANDEGIGQLLEGFKSFNLDERGWAVGGGA